MIVCVVPAYRGSNTISAVVAGCLDYVDRVVVVDDGCPEETGLVVETHFPGERRVEVLKHQVNRGVGAAMKTGIRRALQLGATVVIKVDADGQMDPRHIPQMVALLDANPRLALVKGNRFFDGSVARVMPGIRLLGNSTLTLLVRMTTGYWNGIDPTNGFIALRAETLRRLDLAHLADRYFFEISLLVALGLRRADIAEVEVPARYGNERSSLSIWKTIATFPQRLGTAALRRIVWQYIIADMNVGSLFLVVGTALSLFGASIGASWWIEALRSGVATTPGNATIVLLPLVFGFQLLLNFVLFDVQSSPRVHKFAASELAIPSLFTKSALTVPNTIA